MPSRAHASSASSGIEEERKYDSRTASSCGVSCAGFLLVPSSARWSWFNLWSGDQFALTEEWNEDSMKKKVYESAFVITLDELPDLLSYAGP